MYLSPSLGESPLRTSEVTISNEYIHKYTGILVPLSFARRYPTLVEQCEAPSAGCRHCGPSSTFELI